VSYQHDFGTWLRHARTARELTQEALAEAVGCATQTVRSIENGRRRPSREMAARLADILEMPPDERGAFVRLARAPLTLSHARSTPVRQADAGELVSSQRYIPETLGKTQPQSSQGVPTPAPPLILATKLYIPRPHADLVLRPRLLARLDGALSAPLTVVAAPAGFGKTTVISAWLHERMRDASRKVSDGVADLPLHPSRVAWLTLDASDSDPVLFLRYLIAAFQPIAPAVGATLLVLLQSPQAPPIETLLPLLINDLAALLHPTILVLDDYHTIDSLPIHQALVFLLDYLPPQLHLVIASRTDPPLPLARLRARRQLIELRAADLRFTAEEIAVFLKGTMALPLSAADLAALETRTEGWIAGLQLAALSLQDRPHDQLASFIDAFAGSHRFVVDYLADEVIARQPRHIQTFLLETAILERLCGPLCDAVVLGETRVGSSEEQTGAQAYSQAIIEELERRNLFIIPLDDRRLWYRYHHLFAQVLRQRLIDGARHEAVAPLHQRAAAWFEQQGLAVEAVHHALASQDWERAARLITAHGRKLMVRGQVHTVRGWLNKLPNALASEHPYLHHVHAIGLFFENQHETAERHLQAAEASRSAARSDEHSGIIPDYAMVLRASMARFRGDLARAFRLATQALEIVPATNMSARMVAQLHAALAYEISGDLGPDNQRQLLEGVALARAADELGNLLFAKVSLADFQQRQGRLWQAAQTYREAAEILPEPIGLQAFPNGASYYFGLGSLLYERNDLDGAEALLEQGQEMVRAMRVAEAQVISLGYHALARLQQARGDGNAARRILDELQDVARQRSFAPPVLAQAAAVRAQLALRQGDLSAAVQWADTSGLAVNDDLNYPRELEYLMLARVRIAQGRRDKAGSVLAGVLRLLDRLLAAAETGERIDSVIEISILRALAFQAQGTPERALKCLERALQLAAPERYVRVFIDEGAPMVRLLQQGLRTQRWGRAPSPSPNVRPYAEQLLNGAYAEGIEHHSDAPNPSTQYSVPDSEPLTERELDVLRLLVAGYSNQAIARELVVAVGTVKRHINNIFGKLHVQSRVQAVARARELDLL
jgi:LuxR family maltose regulon positive regulatory protein